MPEVIIQTRNDWFPSDAPERTAGSERRHTKRQTLTLAIARKMPDFVVQTFKLHGVGDLTPDQVVFDITKLHSLCSDNQPDIAVTIVPSWSVKREAVMQEMRESLRAFIVNFIDWHTDCGINSGNFPNIDVMIKFVVETGESVASDGETTSTW